MPTRKFPMRDDSIELDKLLKFEGVCTSGGEAKHLVASGQVSVDGAVELRKGCKLRAGQRVRVGELEIELLAADRPPT